MISKGSLHKRIFLRTVLSLLFVYIAWQAALQSQITTGAVSGTVKDPSGAVLPGATVTATNTETGAVRTTVTSDRGDYQIVSLPVGVYELQVSLSGFQSSVLKGITLSMGQQAELNFALQLGNVAEHVVVSAEAPLIETATATVSGLVNPEQMMDIPLNTRSFVELVPFQAGAVFADNADQGDAVKGFGQKLSIAGTRYNQNLFLLDGAIMNDASNSAGSAAHTMAGVETIQEFRVITDAYDAQYGRHSGGVVNAITKAGTNSVHGSAFEFLRNSTMDARDFFDPVSGPPPFKRNQFGGSLGGPIVKDKTFFFVSYEGLRQGTGVTVTTTVPGMAMRNGYLNGNFIGINPATQPFLLAYPLPTQPDRPDGTALDIHPVNQTTTQDFGSVRIDQRISDSDSLFGRFLIDNSQLYAPTLDGFNTAAVDSVPNRFSTIEETHVLSPRTVMRTLFSFNRTNIATADAASPGYTFPVFSFSNDISQPGIFTVSGLTGWGGSSFNPRTEIQNDFQFSEDVFVTHGRHSIKFGGMMERIQFNMVAEFYGQGSFTFPSLTAFMTDTASAANFVTPGSNDVRGWRQDVMGLYFQDDLRVSERLHLNLGLRYEPVTSPAEQNGLIANINNMNPAHMFTVLPSQTDLGGPLFLNPSLKNYEPRIGLAWSPFANGKTSIRLGSGIFHEQLLPDIYNTSGDRVPPFYSVAGLLSSNGPINFPNAFYTQVNGQTASKPQIDAIQFHIDQPTVYKWSFDIQQQLTSDSSLTVGYTGTRGVHLMRGNITYNTTPAAVVNGLNDIEIQQPVPNPTFDRMRWQISDGTSFYNALLVTYNKTLKRGLQVQLSYTWSKSTDDGSTYLGSSDWNVSETNGFRGAKMHGLSAFDVPQSFFTNFIYQLPGRNWSGSAGKVAGGWDLTGVVRLTSGFPLSVTASQPTLGSLAEVYVQGATVNLIPGGNQNPVSPQNPNHYFDVNQFSFPTLYFQGNLGRNTLFSPGIANVDMSLRKDTKIWKERTLEFRAEFYNLFNRPNFGVPALSLFTSSGAPFSNAGQITNTGPSNSHNPRQIQLALRFAF